MVGFFNLRRLRIGVAALLVLSVWVHPAWAWLETTVSADSVTVDVAADGSAVVAHELLLRVRGGPLKRFTIEGVDPDAEALPDATVTRARSGRAAGAPIPVTFEPSEGRAELGIEHPKGLRTGTYLFRFRYRTHLSERQLLRRTGSVVELEWTGPRFGDGIDSARVVFRVPAAPAPPRLPEDDAEDGVVGVVEEHRGVFLSTVRRSGDHDEIEIVRPHVAKNEVVTWRARVDAAAFPQVVAEPSPRPARAAVTRGSTPREQGNDGALALAAGLGLLYAALVALKNRGVQRAAELCGARAAPLLPVPLWSRVLGSGLFVAGAAIVGSVAMMPTVAGVLLVATMVLAAHGGPQGAPPLRGPGRWERVSDEVAYESPRPRRRLPGRWLDAGSSPGFLHFVVLLALVSGAAVLVFPRSPYHGVLVALGSGLLLPLFFTGRAGELPSDPVAFARAPLRHLHRRLRATPGLMAVPIARLPEGSAEPDELRLLVTPKRAARGLVALEVGVDAYPGPGRPMATPFVIIRALDGSAAYEALPRTLFWTRGRTSDERVALVRPRLPARAVTLRLVRSLAARLTAPDAGAMRQPQPAIRTARPAGRHEAVAKPARRLPPRVARMSQHDARCPTYPEPGSGC